MMMDRLCTKWDRIKLWIWALAFALNSFAVALTSAYGEWHLVSWLNLALVIVFGVLLATAGRGAA